jgi:hypothetical protein
LTFCSHSDILISLKKERICQDLSCGVKKQPDMDNKDRLNYLWKNIAQGEGKIFEGELLKFMDFFCDLLEVQKIDIEREKEFLLYYLDMSSIQMKGTDIIPFFVTRIMTVDQHAINDLFLEIKNKIYKENLQEQITFILIIGETKFFRSLGKDSLLDLVILDESNISRVGKAEKPRSELIRVCKEQINIQKISPYETFDPVVGPMFYGRKWEIKELINRTDLNFVITGCRRVGKSSLLLNAYHRMRNEATSLPLFLDCSPYKTAKDFIDQVVTRLEIRELRRMTIDKFHDFLRRMKSKYKKRITFFLDEVDGLLEIDIANGWQLFNKLRAAHAEGYCRFIITGYRVVFRETLNLESPVYHFMEPIRIHELDHDSAVALITQPIRDMGILFEEQGTIINRILEQTSSQPNLIQFICKRLIEIESKRNSNKITYHDLMAVEKSSEYKHYVTDTFILNSNKKEQLIAFFMLDYPEFSFEDIDRDIGKEGISLSLIELEKICTYLEMANVFKKVEKKYRFSNPALPGILKAGFDTPYFKKTLVREVA